MWDIREMLPDSVNMNTKLKDYLSSSASLLQVTLFTAASSDTKEADIQELSDALRTNKCLASVTIYYISPELLATATDENYLEIIDSKTPRYEYRGDFVIDDNYKFVYEEWRP